MFDVTHAAGMAAIWGSWARYVIDVIPHRLAKFAVNVLGVSPQSDEKATALKGIEAMEDFYRYIGMPTSIKELLGKDVTDEQIDEMAYSATLFGKRDVGTVIPLKKDDIVKIYKMAK